MAGKTWLRMRYQVLIALTLAVLIPAFIHSSITGVWLDAVQSNTMIGGAIALILGFASFKRLHIFPGIASGGYIITSFTICFAALAVVLLLLRSEYSRLQFLISYVVAVCFCTFMHLRFVSRIKIIMGVVPSAATNELPLVKRIEWLRIIDVAQEIPPLDGVVVDLHAEHSDAWSNRIADFALNGTPVYHVKEAIEQLSGVVEITHLSENTLGSLNPNDVYLKTRVVMDAVIAMLILVVASPLMIIAAVLILLDSPGPVMFRQCRTGYRAHPFTVYKFRTMIGQPTEATDDPRLNAITIENDPRITRFGAFLRHVRFDELPQLINVVKGEMGLIGPRPEAIELTHWYEKEIPFYHYRHIIRPGITGWAQINQEHIAGMHDVRQKLLFDFYYIKNFSFWLDVLIVLRTIRTMATGHGAR